MSIERQVKAKLTEAPSNDRVGHFMGKWQQATELLSEGHYERVGQILQVQQEAAQRSGQLATAIFLAAASQLCLTCLQFRAERELHQLGLDEALRREQELRQQIQVVLALLSQQSPREAQADLEAALNLPPSQSTLEGPLERTYETQPNLLQKIQRLLGFEEASGSGRQEIEALHHPLAEQELAPPTETDNKIVPPFIDQDEILATSQLQGRGLAISQAELEMLQAAITSLIETQTQEIESLPMIDPEALVLESQKAGLPPIEEEEPPEESGTTPEAELLQSVIHSMEVPPSKPESSLVYPEDELLVVKAERAIKRGVEKSDFPSKSTGDKVESKTIQGEKGDKRAIPRGQRPEPAGSLVSPTMDKDRPLEFHEHVDSSAPSLVVYCLGSFQVYLNNQPIEHWPSSKGKSIFKYLVTHRQSPVAKEILMDLFWPGSDPDAARNNLNVAVYGLRQAFRNGDKDFSYVIYQNECYLLNLELNVWLDNEEFMERYRSGQRFEREGLMKEAIKEYHAAEALYQGEFLEEDRYEDWLMPLRQQLVNTYLDLLERLSHFYFERHEYASSVTICWAMLAIDPCREDTHARLMLCYDRLGQRHLALRQYHHCLKALREELEVEPTPTIVALYEEIRRHDTG